MIDLDIREMPVLGLLIVVLPVVLVAILVGPGGFAGDIVFRQVVGIGREAALRD